ncbi:MAG: hypothetical protein MI749_00325 [Desulfovibrionales bacterium]|nr:hypothetical protein [Desulfovibrionales bacterium]
MKKIALTVAVASSLLFTGCASIVSDSSYPVSLQSTPNGASFTVTNKNGVVVHSGKTPATVTLKSGAGFFSGATYKITMKKPGHDPKIITVDSTLDGWYIGNILIGGLIGMLIVDPATGAMWKLPEAASAELNEKIAGTGLEEGQLQVVSIDQVPHGMIPSLQQL